MIHPKYNFLGCSPDGLVYDEVEKKYIKIIEIKCLSRFADFTKRKLIKDSKCET